MKEIASLAGVSRGTVDRVLNNRGAVSEETAQKVRKIIKALDYKPNQLGQQLAIRSKNLKFGYILFGSEKSNPFFEDLVAGIKEKEIALNEYGVKVILKFSKIDKPEMQVKMIDELVAQSVDGIVITPICDERVARKIDQVSEMGIPVVTANSDLPDSKRIAYVGSDYFKSGQTAAGLLRLITSGKANVGVIIGSPLVLCHSQRLLGFTEYIKENQPDIRIIRTIQNNDDNIESYLTTRQMLENHPEIDSIFLVAGGVEGAYRAMQELKLSGKLRVISYDTTKQIKKMLQKGAVFATITQEPLVQGGKPLQILLDYVGMGIKPEKVLNYTDLGIKIKENLSDDQ